MSVLMGTKGTLDKELAYMQLGESIGSWAMILAGIFSLFALLTTFWSNTLALRDVVHEQTGIGNRAGLQLLFRVFYLRYLALTVLLF